MSRFCKKISSINISSVEFAGDLLWALVVQKKLGVQVPADIEKELLDVLLKSTRIRSSKSRKILQVRRYYGDLTEEDEEDGNSVMGFTEVTLDDKGKEVRVFRQAELGLNLLQM